MDDDFDIEFLISKVPEELDEDLPFLDDIKNQGQIVSKGGTTVPSNYIAKYCYHCKTSCFKTERRCYSCKKVIY